MLTGARRRMLVRAASMMLLHLAPTITAGRSPRTAPMDAHEAAASEYRPQGATHFAPAAGDIFVPVVGDGIHATHNQTAERARRRQRKLALLNAQWRGGSTLAEQLIFSTTLAPPFLLDEPAKAMWIDPNNHLISTVNLDALRCDFSKFNHTLLLSWQHWRGEFTRQRKLLNYRSFDEMRRRCFTAGNGGHVRGVKTIRMTGELELFSKNCMRERADTGANYSCVLIQLVRHPLSTLRSERNSARLPQARGVKNPTVIAPGGEGAWIDARSGNMSSFCDPLLKDLQHALALQRRRRRLLSKGKSVDHLPQVLILKYDDLLRRPLEVVREAHEMLQVYTSTPKLTAFVKAHLDPNYTVHTVGTAGLPVDAPVVSMANLSASGKGVVHKVRKRLKTEFGTVRPPRRCEIMQSMDAWPSCAELLRLLHPLYLC